MLTYYRYYAIIDSLIYQILFEHLLSSRHCSRAWKYSSGQNKVLVFIGLLYSIRVFWLDCNLKIQSHLSLDVTCRKVWELGRAGISPPISQLWGDVFGFSTFHLTGSISGSYVYASKRGLILTGHQNSLGKQYQQKRFNGRDGVYCWHSNYVKNRFMQYVSSRGLCCS